MIKANKFTYVLAAIFFAVTFIFFSIGGGVATVHAATTSTYSSVLDDLQKDGSFNAEDYPEISNDYSLQVIQIAESIDKDLLIYCYIPCIANNVYQATSINISTSINDNLKYVNYKLKLISESGPLSKYIVEDFSVKADVVRYYDISAIYREWNKDVDDTSDEVIDSNEITEKAFTVAKLYTACTLNDNVSYSCLETQVVEITSKYCGFVSYWSGTNPWTEYFCDAHYIAFSTDWDMDRVMDADVGFNWQTIKKNNGGLGVDVIVDNGFKSVTLSEEDTATVTPRGWFTGNNYSWKRIRTVSQFIEEEKITDSVVLQNLEDKKWVFNFFETEYSQTGPYSSAAGHYYKTIYSTLSDEVIFRISFEQDGIVYNLGVVDNKVTNLKDTPDNGSKLAIKSLLDLLCEFLESITGIPATVWKIIICIIFVLIIFLIFYPVLSPILAQAVKIVLWIISAPFKLIAKLFKKKE